MTALLPQASGALGGAVVAARFEVVRHLGTGGMGSVYEALDRERNLRVALKTLARFEPAFLLHLKNEFRSLQDIRHANLATLGELIEDSGSWFMTMELVEGAPLLEYVRPGRHDPVPSGASETRRIAASTPEHAAASPRPPDGADAADGCEGHDDCDGSEGTLRVDRLRDALVQLARGLGALHEAGKVHRDVKPANILVEATGRLVLVDFGLTVDAEAPRGHARVRAAGTRAYMAPEQAAGEPVGPAADWFGVGVLLYQALTGYLPFRGGEAARRRAAGTLESVRVHEPSAPEDLATLCEELLAVDPAKRPTGRDVLRRLGADVGPEPIRRVPFVGRARERAVIERALEDSRHGPVLVVVRGESGLGKTALVREFLAAKTQKDGGPLVLSGRCYEREFVPYKAFDGIVDALGEFLCREWLASPPAGAAALARVFPVLRRVDGFDPPSERVAGDPQDELARAFAALREVLGSVARGMPLVLAIDDMQWADADSHRLLDDLLRPPLPPSLCVVVTARPGIAGARDVLADLSLRFDDVRAVDLPSLPIEEARRLAREALGPSTDEVVVESIVRESGGHPLFLLTLAGHVPRFGFERGGEVKLDDALWDRAARIEPAARRILELASVAGAPLGAATLASAAGLDRASYDANVRALHAERLVRATPAAGAGLVEPYHDRVRESVMARLDPEALRECHRRLAVALADTSRSAHDAASLVRHLEGAGETARAAHQAEIAARGAEDALAFDLAAEMTRTAMRLGAHEPAALQALRERLAEMLANAGRAVEAAQACVDAAAGAPPSKRLELRRRAADHWLRSGHIERGLAILAGVLDEIGDRFPSQGAAMISTLVGRFRARFRGLRWTRRAESEVAPAVLQRIDVYHAVGVSLALIDPVRGGSFEGKALRLALDAGEPRRLASALAMETGYLASGSGLARGRELLREVVRIDAMAGDGYQGCLAPLMEGFVDYHSGLFRRAAANLREVERRLSDQPGTYFERTFCHCFRLISLRYGGRYGELERGFFDWVRSAERRGDLFSEAAIRFNLNGVWLARDAPDEARRDLVRTRWPAPRGGYHMQHWYEQQSRFEIDLYTGEGRRGLAEFRPIAARLSRSLVRAVRIHRVHVHWLLGRLLLAAAAAGGAGEVGEAARVAGRLGREDVPYARTYALLLRAGIAHRRADDAGCVRFLDLAAAYADANDYPHCASASRLRLGSLVGGARGAALVGRAREWMAEQNIRDPQRMARVWTPGFE
jgi:serine/threonine protein kinase